MLTVAITFSAQAQNITTVNTVKPTQPVIVQIWGLKDGFKSMEANYYGPDTGGNTLFRNEYVKQYGHSAWDEQMKVMDETNDKVDLYLMKLRKDLSTQ
jgi:hypothetical protein